MSNEKKRTQLKALKEPKKIKTLGLEITNLPEDTWSIIASFLKGEEWFYLTRVSQYFYQLLNKDYMLQEINWKISKIELEHKNKLVKYPDHILKNIKRLKLSGIKHSSHTVKPMFYFLEVKVPNLEHLYLKSCIVYLPNMEHVKSIKLIDSFFRKGVCAIKIPNLKRICVLPSNLDNSNSSTYVNELEHITNLTKTSKFFPDIELVLLEEPINKSYVSPGMCNRGLNNLEHFKNNKINIVMDSSYLVQALTHENTYGSGFLTTVRKGYYTRVLNSYKLKGFLEAMKAKLERFEIYGESVRLQNSGVDFWKSSAGVLFHKNVTDGSK
jgi:predicted nucleic acid-binding protein